MNERDSENKNTLSKFDWFVKVVLAVFAQRVMLLILGTGFCVVVLPSSGCTIANHSYHNIVNKNCNVSNVYIPPSMNSANLHLVLRLLMIYGSFPPHRLARGDRALSLLPRFNARWTKRLRSLEQMKHEKRFVTLNYITYLFWIN